MFDSGMVLYVMSIMVYKIIQYLPYFTLRLPRQLLSALETNSELKQYLCVNDLRAVSALQNGPPANKTTTTTTTKILIFFLESSRLDS